MRFEESSVVLRVRPNDLDSLGHVNNATALEYLEAGRWGWMEHNALPRASSVLAVTTRIEVDYRREMGPGEVQVHTALESPSAEDLEDEEALFYRVRFLQRILAGPERHVAVEARVQVAFIREADRSLCSLREFLEAAHESS